MPLNRKSLLGHVETIQLMLGMTDKLSFISSVVDFVTKTSKCD